MKANLYSLDGKKEKEINLPTQFTEPVRGDLIKRAFLAIRSHNIQPYGTFIEAGKRACADLSRRRGAYKGAYKHGISRVPRKTLWRRGTQFGWVGAVASGTRKGRRSSPSKVIKKWFEKMNIKERRKAIRSALAATMLPELVKQRGHRFEYLPSIIENKFENLKKTKEIEDILIKLGLEKELERISVRKVRAGKGKSRGRKYRIKKGPLLVISKQCPLQKAAANLQGIDICMVNHLNVELLAPGANPGRLTIFTEDAIKRLEKENLFTKDYEAPKVTKK